MTSEREHVAMEMAGMSERELVAVLRDPAASLLERNAAADEKEFRDQARFQRDLEKRRR